MISDLERVRAIADYQFGSGAGEILFPEDVSITYSKTTGRIRHIYLGERLLASVRPSDGFLTLTIAGAERLVAKLQKPSFIVVVSDVAAPMVSRGRSVFAKHVIEASPEIRPGDEVIVLDRGRRVIAVGRALLSGEEMLSFDVGVAVRVRRCRLRDR